MNKLSIDDVLKAFGRWYYDEIEGQHQHDDDTPEMKALYPKKHKGELTHDEAKAQILKLIDQKVLEARIEELKLLANAKIQISASPAPFNPEGLPIVTDETKRLTGVLNRYAKERIKEIKEVGDG